MLKHQNINWKCKGCQYVLECDVLIKKKLLFNQATILFSICIGKKNTGKGNI